MSSPVSPGGQRVPGERPVSTETAADRTPPLQGRIVKLADLTDGDVAAWSQLAAVATMPNPLFEPGCLLPARHLVNADQIHLAIAFCGATMYGCFPFQVVERWGAFRRPVMTTQVRRMQYDGTPLLHRDHTVAAARALLCAFTESSSKLPGILVNDWVDDDGTVVTAMQEAANSLGRRAYRYRSWQRPTINRRADEDYRADLSFNVRRHIKRCHRRMTQEFGRALHAEDCTDHPGILDRVIELESAGYKGAEGIALAQHPGEPEWFKEMCDSFRQQHRLRILGFRAGDRHIALQLLLCGDAGWFGLKLLYDEHFSRYGLGIPLIFDATETLFSTTDAAWIDTCTYERNESLLRLYPDRRPVVTLVTPVGGALDRRTVDAVSIGRRAKREWLRRAPRRQAARSST